MIKRIHAGDKPSTCTAFFDSDVFNYNKSNLMARNATRLLARFIAYLQQVLLLLRSALNKATIPGSLYQSMSPHSGKSWFVHVGSLRNRSVGLLALGLLLNVTQVQAQGTIPLQKGMAVLSCFSGIVPNSSDNGAQQNPNGPVLAIFDIRDPQGNGAPFSPVNIWAAPTTGAYHPANWSAANMGELFGVALEEGATSPAIFASTTGITATAIMNLAPKTGGTGGEVFRVNGTTGAVTTLATLPNTTYNFSGASTVFTRYVGLGDITYNRTHNVVYVSNLDNGLVYAINATTGALLGTPFDHNTALADNTSLPFTQFERMVFGVVYRVEDNKLYYAVKAPGPNSNSFLNDNQIYTVNINSDGSINAASKSAAPVITFSPTNGGYGSMVSDMALSSNGSQMLIAEMTLEYQTDGTVTVLRKQAHNANVYKYSYAGGAWAQSLSYVGQIGVFGSVRGNSAGGVDFGFNNYGANGAGTNRDDAAVITADQVLSLPGQQAFGFQISNIVSPNTYATSYVVDLDGATGIGDNDKFTSGDIEVFGDIFDCPTITNPSLAQVFCQGNSGSDITVNVSQNTTNSIRFVRFSSDQIANNGAPTAAELAAIYAGATTLATVTPTGISAPYTATLTNAAANWADTAPGTYYVYAILNPDQGEDCRPVQEIIVTITLQPNLIVTNGSICANGSIDLVNLVTSSGGGSLTFHSTYANAVAGTPVISATVSPTAATNYYVRSTNSSGCFLVKELTVSILPQACGTIQITGPNNN